MFGLVLTIVCHFHPLGSYVYIVRHWIDVLCSLGIASNPFYNIIVILDILLVYYNNLYHFISITS